MIGGGGKIGGPKGPAQAKNGEQNIAKQAPNKTSTGAKGVGDHFDKTPSRAGAKPGASPMVMGDDRSGTAEVLRMARDNPAAARQLVATMGDQAKATAAKIRQELAGMQGALQELGKNRFSKEALKKHAEDLRKKRERIAGLKLRMHLGSRKMALIQQLAGRLGDPKIEEELERLLSNHDKLQTDWGRRNHLLELADRLFGWDDDTPEHLKSVYKADVRSGSDGCVLGDRLHQISPHRALAQLIAQSIDGSIIEPVDSASTAHDGTADVWDTLHQAIGTSLAAPPPGKKKDT